VFNLETNTVIESYDVTFNETAPCPRHVFECAGDKELVESIFIDEEPQGFDGDEDDPLHPSTSCCRSKPTGEQCLNNTRSQEAHVAADGAP
jgi:hypothetical protein